MKTCDYCKDTFVPKYSWNKNRFCSVSCKARGAEKACGKANGNWKGKNVSYSGIHKWINHNSKKHDKCCVCLESKKTAWANVSGKYKRTLDDWIELCYSCHTIYDKGRLA